MSTSHGMPPEPPPSGSKLRQAIRRRPVAWTVTGLAVVLVIAGAIAGGVGAATATPIVKNAAPTPRDSASAASPSPSAPATPSRPVASDAPTPAPLRTCSVATLASNYRLGNLEAQVMNASTGEVLFDRNGSSTGSPASVLKTVTAAAALYVLGPNYTIPTRVVQGSTPGQVVIIGGGDPTLSAGNGSWYTDPPTLTDLATQVKQAWAANPANANQPITSVMTDTSLFTGDDWLSSWNMAVEHDQEGSTSLISPLMVDGDKQNPKLLESPRGSDPAGDAGRDFAEDLGVSTANVTNGVAPAGAKQLGVVYSQPVSSLLNEALLNSDNTVMEMLTRLVAIKEGIGRNFQSENLAVQTALQKGYGLNTSGMIIEDGSGLSANDQVSPAFMTRFMVKVLTDPALSVILNSLPVAGQTGTLGPSYSRFLGSASVADGHVLAKTGSIDTAYTLAGIIHAQDGTTLTFAIFAEGNVSTSARTAIDNLTAAIYKCGNNLSNS